MRESVYVVDFNQSIQPQSLARGFRLESRGIIQSMQQHQRWWSDCMDLQADMHFYVCIYLNRRFFDDMSHFFFILFPLNLKC